MSLIGTIFDSMSHNMSEWKEDRGRFQNFGVGGSGMQRRRNTGMLLIEGNHVVWHSIGGGGLRTRRLKH